VAATSRDNFIVGVRAFHGAPYDGHTLQEAVRQVEKLGGVKASEIYVDRGYRGHNYDGPATVHVARGGMKKLKRSLRKWLKRRSAIEPVIGHAKNDGRLKRNYLKGVEGDRINALLSGCGIQHQEAAGPASFLAFRMESNTEDRGRGLTASAWANISSVKNRLFQGRLLNRSATSCN